MNAKSAVKWVLLAFVSLCVVVLAVRSFRGGAPPAAAPSPADATPAASSPAGPAPSIPSSGLPSATAAEAASKDRVVALYLHGRVRCKSCATIEALSEKTIRNAFSADLASGRIGLMKVNIDLPENERLVTDFQLANRTLVLAEYRGGKAVRFEKLDQVWNLFDDEKAFTEYVGGRLKSFLASR